MSAILQIPPTDPLVFAQSDYDGLELRTMAQACLLLVGESKLAQVLNAGQDPHLMIAATMLGADVGTPDRYEAFVKAHDSEKTAVKNRAKELISQGLDEKGAYTRAGQEVSHPIDDARQAGKVANFGFPGGLGAEKLVLFARKSYKVILLVDDDPRDPKRISAKKLKRIWLATYPEFRKYFEKISNAQGPAGSTFAHFISGRMRGNCPYTAHCNSLFQGLGSDATGAALFLVSRACYVPEACFHCTGSAYNGADHPTDPWGTCAWCLGRGVSPMYGCRLVNYIHDDLHVETPEERGHQVAHELARLMVLGAAPFIPDVPATTKPLLARFWSKNASQVWVPDPAFPELANKKFPEGRRLVPWPEAKAA